MQIFDPNIYDPIFSHIHVDWFDPAKPITEEFDEYNKDQVVQAIKQIIRYYPLPDELKDYRESFLKEPEKTNLSRLFHLLFKYRMIQTHTGAFVGLQTIANGFKRLHDPANLAITRKIVLEHQADAGLVAAVLFSLGLKFHEDDPYTNNTWIRAYFGTENPNSDMVSKWNNLEILLCGLGQIFKLENTGSPSASSSLVRPSQTTQVAGSSSSAGSDNQKKPTPKQI